MSYTDLEDDDWIDDDADDDSEADLLSCPSCGRAVHEDTQQCPYCGDWITPVYAEGAWKRWIWAAAAVMVIVSMILVAVL